MFFLQITHQYSVALMPSTLLPILIHAITYLVMLRNSLHTSRGVEGTPKFRHLFYVLSSYLRVYSSANFKGAIPNALCILERL